MKTLLFLTLSVSITGILQNYSPRKFNKVWISLIYSNILNYWGKKSAKAKLNWNLNVIMDICFNNISKYNEKSKNIKLSTFLMIKKVMIHGEGHAKWKIYISTMTYIFSLSIEYYIKINKF